MSNEIQTEAIDYERAAKESGWKRVPNCKFVKLGEGGKLYCSYYYNEARDEMLDELGPQLFDDIGMDRGLDAEVWKGNLVRGCSVKECPNFSARLMNRLRSGPHLEE